MVKGDVKDVFGVTRFDEWRVILCCVSWLSTLYTRLKLGFKLGGRLLLFLFLKRCSRIQLGKHEGSLFVFFL